MFFWPPSQNTPNLHWNLKNEEPPPPKLYNDSLFWHLLVNHLTDSPRWRVVRCTGQVGAGWLQVEPGSCSQFLALERSHFLFFGKCLVRRQFPRQLRNSVEIWPLGNVIMHSSSNSSSLPFWLGCLWRRRVSQLRWRSLVAHFCVFKRTTRKIWKNKDV